MSVAPTPSNDVYHGYAVFSKGIDVKPHSYPARVLEDNCIEIKVTHCGICGSDLHTIKEEWDPITFPQVVGHEIIGVVTKLGKNVDSTRYAIGTRVGVGAQCGCCHSCGLCNKSRENMCEDAIFTYNSTLADGYVTQGGYADYYRCDAQFAIPIPEGLESEAAAPLMCAGITVYSPLRRFGAGPGKRVGIVGIGGLGHLGVKWAVALGAEVTAISSSERKRDDALNLLGAKHYLNSSDKAAMKAANRSLDLIVCTAFGPETDWNELLKLVDVDGDFVLVGLPENPLSVEAFSLVKTQVSLSGSMIDSPEEIEKMLQLAAAKGVKPVVEVLPMTQVAEALKKMEAGKARFRIVLQN
ncbi:hypothetical protein HK098_000042 [Nowakowskiella sp. JEL0407]|nr:hypothetical protein HK098_000042 [Nowakowskiella sp. JEL0407]